MMMMGASAAFEEGRENVLHDLLSAVLEKTLSDAGTDSSVSEPLGQAALYLVFLMKGTASTAALQGKRPHDCKTQIDQYGEVLKMLLASLLRDGCELDSNSSPCFRGCMYAAITHHLQQVHVVAAIEGEQANGQLLPHVANLLNSRAEQLLQLLATDASNTGGLNNEVHLSRTT
jgi:hypothetical protein